jgi:tRNA(Ile)-lysidine synthase
VRTRGLPVLEDELGPGVAATLARTADQLRDDMELLDELAGAATEELAGRLPVEDLAVRPAAIRRRVLRLAALAAGAPASELFHEHVLAMDALITDWRGQKWIDLPGPLRCVRREGFLVLEQAPAPRSAP